jgi:hypothetical protein
MAIPRLSRFCSGNNYPAINDDHGAVGNHEHEERRRAAADVHGNSDISSESAGIRVSLSILTTAGPIVPITRTNTKSASHRRRARVNVKKDIKEENSDDDEFATVFVEHVDHLWGRHPNCDVQLMEGQVCWLHHRYDRCSSGNSSSRSSDTAQIMGEERKCRRRRPQQAVLTLASVPVIVRVRPRKKKTRKMISGDGNGDDCGADNDKPTPCCRNGDEDESESDELGNNGSMPMSLSVPPCVAASLGVPPACLSLLDDRPKRKDIHHNQGQGKDSDCSSSICEKSSHHPTTDDSIDINTDSIWIELCPSTIYNTQEDVLIAQSASIQEISYYCGSGIGIGIGSGMGVMAGPSFFAQADTSHSTLTTQHSSSSASSSSSSPSCTLSLSQQLQTYFRPGRLMSVDTVFGIPIMAVSEDNTDNTNTNTNPSAMKYFCIIAQEVVKVKGNVSDSGSDSGSDSDSGPNNTTENATAITASDDTGTGSHHPLHQCQAFVISPETRLTLDSATASSSSSSSSDNGVGIGTGSRGNAGNSSRMFLFPHPQVAHSFHDNSEYRHSVHKKSTSRKIVWPSPAVSPYSIVVDTDIISAKDNTTTTSSTSTSFTLDLARLLWHAVHIPNSNSNSNSNNNITNNNNNNNNKPSSYSYSTTSQTNKACTDCGASLSPQQEPTAASGGSNYKTRCILVTGNGTNNDNDMNERITEAAWSGELS